MNGGTNHTLFSAAPAAPEWEHLKKYGYAPGNYMNRCCWCNQVKNDLDKRAVACRPCAEERYSAIEGKQAAPVVYGLPAQPSNPVAKVEYDDIYVTLVVHGVEVNRQYRRRYHEDKFSAIARQINAAVKEGR
jgi:hypothetical protein